MLMLRTKETHFLIRSSLRNISTHRDWLRNAAARDGRRDSPLRVTGSSHTPAARTCNGYTLDLPVPPEMLMLRLLLMLLLLVAAAAVAAVYCG